MVHRLLQNRGFETLYLHYRDTVKHARRKIAVLRPYFPRYVFVGVPPAQSLHEINSMIGVSTVLYCGDEPLVIPDAVIEELRARGDEHGFVKVLPKERAEHRKRYRRGQRVRIAGGPLEGLFAIVSLDSGDQVRVWLEMFGGKVGALFYPEGLKSGSPEGGTIRIPPRQNRR